MNYLHFYYYHNYFIYTLLVFSLILQIIILPTLQAATERKKSSISNKVLKNFLKSISNALRLKKISNTNYVT